MSQSAKAAGKATGNATSKPVYTPEEFALRCERRGLTHCIRIAEKYVEENEKAMYSEDDFIDAYHAMNPEPIGRHAPGYCADGEYYGDPLEEPYYIVF